MSSCYSITHAKQYAWQISTHGKSVHIKDNGEESVDKFTTTCIHINKKVVVDRESFPVNNRKISQP